MARIFVPGLIDLVLADTLGEITQLADDARMDRRFEAKGPLVNRLLAGRIRRVLQVDGKPLPSVAPRGDEDRAREQAALEARLSAAASAFASGSGLDELAAFVRGEKPEAEAGPLVQQVVGRAFAEDFAADASTWADARVLDAAPRSFNPFLLLFWALTGRVGRARGRLFNGTHSGAGVHATGIAVHNLVRGIEAMRKIWADPASRANWSAPAVVAHCIFAPPQVVRQALRAGSSPVAPFGEGGLALLRLEKASSTDPGPESAFLTHTWSRCPAHSWVPALLSGVWERARSGPA